MFLGSSNTSFSAKTDKIKLKLFSISEITETHWYTGNWGKFGVLGPLYRRPSVLVWDIAGVEEVELVEVLLLVFGTLGPLWNQSKFLIKNSGHIKLIIIFRTFSNEKEELKVLRYCYITKGRERVQVAWRCDPWS